MILGQFSSVTVGSSFVEDPFIFYLFFYNSHFGSIGHNKRPCEGKSKVAASVMGIFLTKTTSTSTTIGNAGQLSAVSGIRHSSLVSKRC